jgi:hypothetical protein
MRSESRTVTLQTCVRDVRISTGTPTTLTEDFSGFPQSLQANTNTVKVKVKLSLRLTNQALRHEGVQVRGCIDPHYLDLGTSSRCVVSFTPLPLYPRGKRPRYPLDRSLGGPRASLDDLEKRKFLTLPGFELRPLGRPGRSQSLYRLRYPGFLILRPYLTLVHNRFLPHPFQFFTITQSFNYIHTRAIRKVTSVY